MPGGRERRVGRGGRKGGKRRGPESGNGAALRHSDTRAHVKWRVHARGSSLQRTIRASPLRRFSLHRLVESLLVPW